MMGMMHALYCAWYGPLCCACLRVNRVVKVDSLWSIACLCHAELKQGQSLFVWHASIITTVWYNIAVSSDQPHSELMTASTFSMRLSSAPYMQGTASGSSTWAHSCSRPSACTPWRRKPRPPTLPLQALRRAVATCPHPERRQRWQMVAMTMAVVWTRWATICLRRMHSWPARTAACCVWTRTPGA